MGDIIMKTLIINFYANSVLAKNTEEAVNFINSLEGIQANESTIKNLKSYFDGENRYMMNRLKSGLPYEIATTGCGKRRIHCYRPLAKTLEAHNEQVLKNKQAKAEEEKVKANERFQTYMNDMLEPCKGWYIVTITGSAFKERGNDGKVMKSLKILADNKMDAYNKAVEFLTENPPKNVSFWSYFEDPKYTLFEYVGVWTDEAELEFK